MGTDRPSRDQSASNERAKRPEQTNFAQSTPAEFPQSYKGVTEWQSTTDKKLGAKLIQDKVLPNPVITEPLLETRKHLDQAIRASHLDNASKAAFLKDMRIFEQRSTDIRDNLQKQGHSDASLLAEQEVSRTYSALNKLLEAKDNNNVPFKANDRMHIAQEIIHNCAQPDKISQGFHYTCPTDGLQVVSFYRHPSEAANLIAEVATTGKFTTSSGMTVTIDKASLAPHDEARQYPPADGKRGLAGQIYDLTATNIYWSRYNKLMGTNYRYEQREPNSANDTGERLSDYSGMDTERLMHHGQPARNPGLFGSEPIDIIANEISSHPAETLILEHQMLDTRQSSEGIIKSYQDFDNKLKELAERGKLPVMLCIDLGNEPFRSDYDSPIKLDINHPMLHTVIVTKYYPGTPPRAATDNLWGTSDDHLMSSRLIDTAVLYKAMRHPLDPSNNTEYKQEMQRRRKLAVNK